VPTLGCRVMTITLIPPTEVNAAIGYSAIEKLPLDS